jgi:hypothetical protein
MRLRPWHVLVCVLSLSALCIGFAYTAGERGKDILLGVGVNLLSSVVFFVLLEIYWQRMKRANGKEVGGFDYLKFARNVARSRRVRVLGTFIYPLTDHPAHAEERKALADGLKAVLDRPSALGIQFLFLNPTSSAARARAAERTDDDVLRRMAECLAALRELAKLFEGHPARGRLEIRFFSRTPPFALFQTDDFGSISFYYRDRPISEVTRYEFFTDSPIGDFVEKTFDDLWRDSQTVSLEEYLLAHPDDLPKPSGDSATPAA